MKLSSIILVSSFSIVRVPDGAGSWSRLSSRLSDEL
jgi:hypothetical protein